ncbi:MAG TPA: kinase [Elusimicrobiota bacterium]|nr:kinase [Elusimicrobiota bacterium]
MIISRTPFRVSFFGGGTDYPGWFRENGGSVLATTIDKYCYLTCRYLPPFFEHRSRILYSKVEMVRSNAEIEHPAVRAVLAHFKITEGVEIHHDGDLPARTGLGSSSAFAVGLLHGLHTMQHTMPSKMDLALGAIHVEQELLKENVGCQDQVIAAFGGLNRIDFRQNGAISVNPIPVNQERLNAFQDHLLLYFTGFSRIASVIVQEQIARIKDTKAELTRMHRMVDEAVGILTRDGNLEDIGRLLDESWSIKRSLSSKISSPAIDEIYSAAREAGALGGKLLGAGGGGFMLLFARPQDHGKIKQKLDKLMRIPFRFENDGSRIIVYQPDTIHENALA